MDSAYRRLADAIIMQAVRDYRVARSNGAKSHIIRFFRSKWFGVLTDLDGEMIVERLKNEGGQTNEC